ncbi:MAG: DUF3006 domain-containing protein [Oscillospiraceae bacterium]|nr:DUF3006 domain-containing protein [Oscillospiraceae bacterium]
MTMILDRFEDDFAVAELYDDATGEVFYKNIPLSWLPEDAAEGDVIVKTDGKYAVDTKETEKRRAKAAARLQDALSGE